MSVEAFEGRARFEQAVIDAWGWAAEKGSRDLLLWDASFVDWPLSEAALLQSLSAWARPGRRLQMLALQYDDVQRRHPRFVRWRRDHAHCVTACAVDPELRLEDVPQALLLMSAGDERLSMKLFDRRLWRGEISTDPGDHVRGLEWFDAAAQRSSESFAPTTLGL